MKLNPIQIVASAIGAVLAAVIASFFGVQGTVIGVLVGSIVASTASVVMFQSMDRTHKAVRQVVLDPKHTGILRNRGGTTAAGSVTARTEEPGPAVGTGVGTEPGGSATGAEHTGRLESSSGAEVVGDSGTAAGRGETSERRLVARSGPGWHGERGLRAPAVGAGRPPANVGTGHLRPRRRFGWPVVVLTSVLGLVAALVIITVIELAAGETLSTLFGVNGAKGKTSIGAFVAPSPGSTTTTSPTSSTTTTSTSTTTTTTTTTPSSTTTTTPSSTTTTAPSSTSTTAPSSTSTTLPAGTATTTPKP